jgi:hypothetical protein
MSNVASICEHQTSYTTVQVNAQRELDLTCSVFLDDEDVNHVKFFTASFSHLLKPGYEYSLSNIADLVESSYSTQDPKTADAVRFLRLANKVTDIHSKHLVRYIKRDNLKGCLDYFYTLNGEQLYKLVFHCGFSLRQFAKNHKAILKDIQSQLILAFARKSLPVPFA